MKATLTLVRLLMTLHTLAFAQLFAQNAPASKEVPGLHVFKISEDCLHFCQDNAEAERRWNLTKSAFTADVYVLEGADRRFSLTPILKYAVVQTIGGGSRTELTQFGVDVTPTQRTQIEEALQKKQLFIVYYHYGW